MVVFVVSRVETGVLFVRVIIYEHVQVEVEPLFFAPVPQEVSRPRQRLERNCSGHVAKAIDHAEVLQFRVCVERVRLGFSLLHPHHVPVQVQRLESGVRVC